MKQSDKIKVPCETCLHKNGIECFRVLALFKAARSMEMELYNHGVESLVSSFTLPCSNYISEENYVEEQYRKIV
ncbi:MAG: hypothetical protein JL50_19915 [Peptococcaceae bacterium BICA1-7]|nr:MAG: hypothetical protein JL50_19915 [Peptococcaceae bacterium BICA1-7]HBV98345.1 hypothetical protein [Desulfotomaculum sp.]